MQKSAAGFLLAGLLFAPLAHAQELSWTPLELVDAKPNEPIPTVGGLYRPDIPEQLAKLNEPAYAEIVSVVSKDGKVTTGTISASNPWIAPAASEVLAYRRIKIPDTATSAFYTVRYALLFNPRSSVGKYNATPRVVAAYAAHWPEQDHGQRMERNTWEDAVPVSFDISADGEILAAKVVPKVDPKFSAEIEAAAKRWKFEPAHDAHGQPIAGHLQASVVFELPRIYNVSELTAPPVITRQRHPEYPMELRRSGQGGEVVLRFVVNTKGTVEDIQVISSNNSRLNNSAITAVEGWRFKPGMKDGKAVKVLMQIPMVFSLGDNTSNQFEVTRRQSDDVPEYMKYDFPPVVKNAAHGVYPRSAAEQRQKGKVDVRFLVLPSGRVRFIDDGKTPLSDFDRAARAMLEEFTFTPASKAGKPTLGFLHMTVEFSLNSQDAGLSSSAQRILKELKKKQPNIVQLNQVDEKPHPISRRAPIYPAELVETKKPGQAMIDFFIDEDGHAQLPSIVSSTEPAMGFSAVQAVSEWVFAPLKSHGKPVIVHAQIPFKFEYHEPESEDAKSDEATSKKSDAGAS
ncbi:MAG TPA: TonB family protein [Opitutaceae bacterium]|nr:TonB family protein [Opitutaceae bacterium]